MWVFHCQQPRPPPLLGAAPPSGQSKSSLPADYEQQLAKSTQKGLRVIAIAVKLFENIDSMEIQSLKRDHVENDLHFLGFLVMENKLKEQTCETIDTLNDC